MSKKLDKELIAAYYADTCEGEFKRIDVDSAFLENRILNFGEGLFETFAIIGSDIPLWSWHEQRLLCATYRTGIELSRDNLSALKRLVLKEASLLGAPMNGVVGKIVIGGGQVSNGYMPEQRRSMSALLQIRQVHYRNVLFETQGVGLVLSSIRLSGNANLVGIKHTSQLEYCIAARQAWPIKANEQLLLLDQQGNVCETLHHNLFMVKSGELVTPSLLSSGVRGVARRIIIRRIAPALGISVVKRDFTWSELFEADEIFIANSVRGVWPVSHCIAKECRVGPITQKIQKCFNHYWNI